MPTPDPAAAYVERFVTFICPNCGREDDRLSDGVCPEAQTVSATGRPNRWRQLGAEVVERHGEALRKLAES